MWCELYIHLTCSRRPKQHGAAFYDSDQSNGLGEPLRSHEIHQALKYQGEHHAEADAEERRVDHQAGVARGQGAQEVAGAVEDHGEAEEVLDAGPDPPGVGQQPGAGPGEHVHEAHDGEQRGGGELVHAPADGVGRQEDDGRVGPEEEHGVPHEVDDEASVFEEGQVYNVHAAQAA